MYPREIHQMLPFFAYGDAIGNQALEIRRLLRESGYRSHIFAENWDTRLAEECYSYREYYHYSHPDNLLLLHYSTGAEINRYVMDLPDRVILYYHNITPARYMYWVNGELARQLKEARQELENWAEKVPAIAASPYNAEELRVMGFRVIGIAPYILTFEQLDAGLKGQGSRRIMQQFANPTMRDWLYVGRIAPNKCIQHIIKSFYYYHTWINPNSRLFLVGEATGMEEYANFLKGLTVALNIQKAVIFSGHFGANDGLATFYQIADLYISMSEHEGFCVPLVEAMYYGLPIVAYASTGVTITLGNAGVLVRQKEYAVIAEIANEIIENDTLRLRLLERQYRRLATFAPEIARIQFHKCLAVATQC